MEINWLELWRELVIAGYYPKSNELAQRYEKHARKRMDRPDPLLDFVLKEVDSLDRGLDIGAGSGRWTIPLAKKVKTMSVVEPSDKMAELLRENAATGGLGNIDIISTTWEEAKIGTYDFIVCSHAMYTSPDLAAFVRKMEQYTRKECYLAVRLPPADGILGELSLAIYGRRHDSPDAIIAYNALYSLGIYANVLVENGIVHWENATIEEAFSRAKRHLRLEKDEMHDKLIHETLGRRLQYVNNSYIWPDGMRSALLWWSPAPHR
jgi:SAM-dependent methyltransferase